MSDISKIQWTDATWNPVTGCSKVSAGCKNCYAERDWSRIYGKQVVHPKHVDTDFDAATVDGFQGVRDYDRPRPRRFTDVQCHSDRLDQPLRWRKPRRVFVNSMSDLFHDDVPDEFIGRVFNIMARCPAHTFQILTKRPHRMRDLLGPGSPIRAKWGRNTWCEVSPEKLQPNVWLGVSAEDQATADERIPILLDTPAAVRFVSAEPLLSAIDFLLRRDATSTHDVLAGELSFAGFGVQSGHSMRARALDWVIVGGESGPKARPCDVAWIRSIVQQCKGAGVPCCVKQVGYRPEWERQDALGDLGDSDLPRRLWRPLLDRKGGNPDEWPEDLRVRQWPEVKPS